MDVHNINNERIAELAFKYLLRQLTDEEQEELNKWVAASPENEATFRELTDRTLLRSKVDAYNQFDEERIWGKIVGEVPEVDRGVKELSDKRSWWWLALAAAMMIGIVLGGFYLLDKKTDQNTPKNLPIGGRKDVMPAGNKAVLTLANGSNIVLDSAGIGTIAHEERTSISKPNDGALVYKANPGTSEKLLYNTVSTPRGGKYQLMLPDGSKVWLNAASSLRFPVAFNGSERKVELKGEAYFEIVSDKLRPFKVSMLPSSVAKNKGEVVVLGTHFNVNAYEDEPEIKVTLLEGSINISKELAGAQLAKIIKPGQQAILADNNKEIGLVNKEDPSSSIAWINGLFSFDKVSFGVMMRELSRWYNVDIVYEGSIPTNTIIGEVDRTMPLSELLSTLEKMGNTHFKIEGRTVRVLP